jgi:hypothetical protein
MDYLERPKQRQMDMRFEIYLVGGLIHLAQDRDQWQILVNTVMGLRVA